MRLWIACTRVNGRKVHISRTVQFQFQQQQRPDLSRLMQLQAAGAGLPTSMAGLPPGLLGGASAHGIPGLPHGIPISSAASLLSGLPPTTSAAMVAQLNAMRSTPSMEMMMRKEAAVHAAAAAEANRAHEAAAAAAAEKSAGERPPAIRKVPETRPFPILVSRFCDCEFKCFSLSSLSAHAAEERNVSGSE